jgi:hypothetical protein
MDLRSPAQNVKKGPAHYRQSRAIRCLLSVPLLCRIEEHSTRGRGPPGWHVSAPALGSQALRPLCVAASVGRHKAPLPGWLAWPKLLQPGGPASLPSSAARGPMERPCKRRGSTALIVSLRCNGLEVDEAAACGMPVAVTMPWERNPSYRTKKHSHVCDLQHSIYLITHVASLRLSGSGPAAKDIASRGCGPGNASLPPAPDSPYHQRPRRNAGQGVSAVPGCQACFRTVPTNSQAWTDSVLRSNWIKWWVETSLETVALAGPRPPDAFAS